MSLASKFNPILSSSMHLVSITILFLIEMVKAKECQYYYDTGEIKQFHCNLYEFCCGISCCRSRGMTFYQMWYFWLMVFLTILFCSGGSWWYRIRNHEYTSRGPQVLSPRVTVYSGAIQNQSYPTINPGALPMQNTQYQCPPPPYYGPPPSYDTAVNQVQAPIRQG